MKPYTSADIHAYAKWLTQACQESGLDAEQYGGEVFIRGISHHLSERVVCGPDTEGVLRWCWSWGRPVGHPAEPSRPLSADDVDELVRAIRKVVIGPDRSGA